eukprot:jgi/Tetstr1/448427/TSEL_035697.t1
MLLAFAAGVATGSAGGGVTAAGQAEPLVAADSLGLSLCDRRLRAAQSAYFLSHTCWLNAGQVAGWAALRVLYEPGLSSPETTLLLLSTSSGEEGDAADELGDASALLASLSGATRGLCCGTSAYIFAPMAEHDVLWAAAEREGLAQRVRLLPSWDPLGGSGLDVALQQASNTTLPEAPLAVKLPEDGGNPMATLQGMAALLASGRVRMLQWSHAQPSSAGSMGAQVEYVAGFGFAEGIPEVGAAPWLRVDRGLWERHYERLGGGGRAWLVAVAVGDAVRAWLDAKQLLCPRRAWWAKGCACREGGVSEVDDACGLLAEVGDGM